jgi:hypothetical protein
MPIDLRRCAEAAAHAALAEAFSPPPPRRRSRRRRLRSIRALLVATGLITLVRMALTPKLRRAIFEALSQRFPIEDLLDELVLNADVVPEADDYVSEAGAEGEDGQNEGDREDEADSEQGPKRAGAQQRRRVARARGDTNGQHGRKPPNRGTRA